MQTISSMKRNPFEHMTSEEFKAFQPRTEDEEYGHEKETDYREWCEEEECDPLDPDSRHVYKEYLEENGDGFWENLDEDELAGWEDNMHKD